MADDRDSRYLVLGLDPGIESCGFALLDMNGHKILEMGSRLFDTPQEPKTKVSLAAERRGKRSARRNVKRTSDRLKHCLELLKAEGLVPEDADKGWLQTAKGDKPTLDLRVKGLDKPLADREWAQVLYSLCGRRGYIPHGSGSDDQDDDAGKVLSAISENESAIAASGFRTVGEYLYHKQRSRNRSGDYSNCVSNTQLVDEARTLFSKQAEFGGRHTTPEFCEKFISCMEWQRDSADRDRKSYDAVCPCIYFPDEKRAANADLSSELLRAQERLAHVTILYSDGSKGRLTLEQRRQCMDELFSPNGKKSLTYKSLRKITGMDSRRDFFKGVDAESEQSDVFRPKAWDAMRAGLPVQMLERFLSDHELADSVGEAMTYASSEASLREKLAPLDLSSSEIDAIVALPFAGKTFKGYGSRSLKAIYLLLPMFDESEILTLSDAEQACGLQGLRMRGDVRQRNSLLPPYSTYDPSCRNPVVLRAMGQMRKVVNAITRRYGVPNVIRIELGRELKMSAKEKTAVSKENARRRKEKEVDRKTIAELIEKSPDDVPEKLLMEYELWVEQGKRDVYTNEKIDLERLVSDQTYCQIDHVLPYSRTCDDSRHNKVLVLAGSNQRKRERTPKEWMEQDADIGAPVWDEFAARVRESKLSAKKKARLLRESLSPSDEQGFIDRNLNDTRYMSVAVKNFVESYLEFPEDGSKAHVFAVAGAATANLRRSWGLNFGAGDTKDRRDDRHHAVDAAVIAACSPGIVKRMAEVSSRRHEVPREQRKALFAGVQPWDGFADDVRAARELVVPTRMPDHGVTGQAFEETTYRFEGYDADGHGMGLLSSGCRTGKPKTRKNGNFVKTGDGGARIVGDMAFLRLWLDKSAKKGRGCYLAEPVYCADIPTLKSGDYSPRAVKSHTPRAAWPPVSDAALSSVPIVLFRNDVISVNGRMGRFGGMDISSNRWRMLDLLTSDEIKDFPSISKLTAADDVHLVSEDVLGECYRRSAFADDSE